MKVLLPYLPYHVTCYILQHAQTIQMELSVISDVAQPAMETHATQYLVNVSGVWTDILGVTVPRLAQDVTVRVPRRRVSAIPAKKVSGEKAVTHPVL